jgi:hypothetical protein
MSTDPHRIRITLAKQAAAHLREDAEFNRHLTRSRGQPFPVSAAYTARRIEVANQREQWAEAIESLCADCTTKDPESDA